MSDKVILERKIGENTTYYFQEENELIHSKSFREILKHKKDKEIDKEQLEVYFRWGHNPTEKTIVNGIRKLLVGQRLEFKEGVMVIKNNFNLEFKEDNTQSIGYWKKTLFNELKGTLEKQSGDKPIGVFLSGGLDSSSLIPLLSELGKEIHTFSVGFEGCNEFENAKKVAKRYNTIHHQEIISVWEVDKYFEAIIKNLEEPVSNLAVVPLYFLSKKAKEYTTKVFTGSGGDELFGGYRHYKIIIFARRYKFLLKLISNIIPNVNKYTDFIKKLSKNNTSEERLFEFLRLTAEEDVVPICEIFAKSWSILNKLSAIDIMFLDPENYLFVEKKMATHYNLNIESPYASNGIIKISERIPTRYKLSKTYNGKYIMKKTFEKYLPKEILGRKKNPFQVPLKSLWNECFKNKLLKLLPDIKKQKILDYREIEGLIKKATLGENKAINKLCTILIFQTWYNEVFLNE